MINEANYSQQNIKKIGKYFLVNECNIDEKIIKKHLYCLGLLEAFSKIGMNYILLSDMAVYLMTDNNLYLPENLEIAVNKQDFLEDYLLSANELFKALEYKMIYEKDNQKIYEYKFLRTNKEIITIFLHVIIEDHITNDVISIAINKPYLIQEDRVYRTKTPYFEALFAHTLFCFSPNELSNKLICLDSFSLFLIKKVVDMAQLYPYLKRFDIVIDSFEDSFEKYKANNQEAKMEYLLYDSYNSLLNIYCQGLYRPEYYAILEKGIEEIQKFKLNDLLLTESIFQLAAYPLLACACIYQKIDCLLEFEKIKNFKAINFFNYTKINNMRKYNKKYFNVVCQAIDVFDRLNVIEKVYHKKNKEIY